MAAEDEYYVKPTAGGFVCQAVEFRHSSLAAPLRFCNDAADRTLPIESGAPANAGTNQTFLAARFSIADGQQNADGLPEFPLTLADNAASYHSLLVPAMDTDEPVEVTLREFGGTVAAPVLLRLVYNLQLRGGGGRIGAGSTYRLAFRQLTAVRIPRTVYDAETAPGLLV